MQRELEFAPFRNEGLFTDHYLQHVLPEESNLCQLDDFAQVHAQLQTLWQEQADQVEGYNEAQLEDNFIKRVLAILGHVWEVQTLAGRHQPDYGFFPSDEARDRARSAEDGTAEYWQHAFAVGDAKQWDQKLDRALTGGSGWDFQNPSFQIYYYLAETGCRWAILTNGRKWRLYSSEPKPDMQVFFEIDLPTLLQSDKPEDLAYFWLFFRQEAFQPDADGVSFLERVHTEANLAAEQLREDVRERVYKALEEACRGFADYETGDLSEQRLKAIYDNALVFLYRLLFIFYAEAGELLPLRESSSYRDRFSLQAIERDVHDHRQDFRSGTVTLWPRLQELFHLIDSGPEHADLGVPAYNGGLFDPERHPFLEENRLTDARTARVLELLARTEEGSRFDFRDLGVRHLGSIYEGLLEYSLAQADQPMAVVRQRGSDLWAPADTADDDAKERIDAGDLYLVTDRGERKATGSYYTPQFIVEYIVENTLGPLVEEAESAEDILRLNVLDPAMGSGHFLVEATDYLARKLLEREAQREVLDEDTRDEDDLTRLKRLVVERCIFGVDLNPLAVELAKLSLWLDTVAKGQPLSFLDHHLRIGDSLIGADVARIPVPPHEGLADEETQSRIDDESFAHARDELVSGIDELTSLPSRSRADVHEKERRLKSIDENLRGPYKRIADVWCSHHFGNTELTGVGYIRIARALQKGNTDGLMSPELEPLARADTIADQYRFFHWELEFPEVFFEADGQPKDDPGFDAVIGNPPWERIKLQQVEFFGRRAPDIAVAPTAARRKAMIAELPETDPELWQEYQDARERADRVLAWTRDSGQYPLMGRGDTNLYAVMTERGRDLLREEGRLGFVVPSGIATDKTTSYFFGDLVEQQALQTLLDFENKEGLFHDVHREQKFSIIILSGGEPQQQIDCGFFLHGPEDMADGERVFTLNADDFALFNPNTLTCPVFRTSRDAGMTRAIYKAAPVLIRHTDDGEENLWGVRYFTMFHMTNDADLFRTAQQLEAEGFYPTHGNRWRRAGDVFLPLYEGKMIHHFDHRYADALATEEATRSAQASHVNTPRQKTDPDFQATPRYWVPAHACSLPDGTVEANWYLGFRDIVNPNNVRTFITAFIPPVAAGNKIPLIVPTDPASAALYPCLCANLCAFAFDYVARRKIGSRTANLYAVEQLPVLPPERYDEDFGGVRLADFVTERVLELTYTAHDMAGFAEDMGYVDEDGEVREPFEWDEERRLHLRCQLDALYFHLYDLDREDAAYILDTFPIVREHDERDYGHYRTKDLILHYYNAYAAGDMSAWVEG